MNSCNYRVSQFGTSMVDMRVTLPLLRIPAGTRSDLRYGVAVLSTALALIPTVLLADVSESRLALFGVAVMVSAWYGGWKPGVVATAFALTVSAYFSLAGEHTPAEFRTAILRLSLFFFVAMLICWLNAALRAAQENLRRSELNFRSLVTNAPYGICRCDSTGKILDANPAFLELLGHASADELVGQHIFGLYAEQRSVVRPGRLSALSAALQGTDRGMEAQERHDHRGSRLRTFGDRTAARGASFSNCSPKTSPSAAPSSSNCASRRRWKPSAAWRAASRMTSTTC